MEAATQTHRRPQILVRWGRGPQAQHQIWWESCSWGGLGDARSMGVAWAAGNWHLAVTVPLAPGHHHPSSTQDITTA